MARKRWIGCWDGTEDSCARKARSAFRRGRGRRERPGVRGTGVGRSTDTAGLGTCATRTVDAKGRPGYGLKRCGSLVTRGAAKTVWDRSRCPV